MGRSVVPEKLKLLLGVLALQLCYGGFHIVSRTALNMGISKVVFAVYRNVIALILLVPFAYFLEKEDRPPLTLSLIVEFFLLGLCGITANQGFYLLGLYHLSPTYASAIQNAAPAITFAMAAALRLEQLNITRREGLAKVVGTLASIAGATIITLYKGPPLIHHQLNPFGLSSPSFSSPNQTVQWTLGCVYILGNCLAWCGWMVLQVPVLKRYPARLSVTALTCFFGLLQFLAIAAFTEAHVDHWKVHSGGELFTILYAVIPFYISTPFPSTCYRSFYQSMQSFVNFLFWSSFVDEPRKNLVASVLFWTCLQGLVASGIAFSLQIWCIDRGGPVIVAVFQPVQTIAVAIMASLILGDQLYAGGVIGASFITVGLYFVLWGKTRERRIAAQQNDSDSAKHLLEDRDERRDTVSVIDFP